MASSPTAPPVPPASAIVLVDKMGDYLPWAQRNPDVDAIPYVIGAPLPKHIRFRRVEVAREAHPIVRWCLATVPSLLARGGAVRFEDWPPST